MQGRAVDASTLANWWSQLQVAMLKHAGPCRVVAAYFALAAPIKVKRKATAPSARQQAERARFASLITSIYGDEPGHFAEGQWNEAASEIARGDSAIIRKYLSMRVLTEKVMGDAKYMPNPCVMICPFAGPRCVHGSFRMNGACKPSQLYSHWQHMHPGNPAARQLEVRWRQAIKNKGITLAQLDVCAPVQMEGDEEAGYEPLRTAPTGGDDHFPHTF